MRPRSGVRTGRTMRCKPAASPTTARMDAFARGGIWALHLAGVHREDMVKWIEKKDGTHPQLHAIDQCIAKKRANPDWRGEESLDRGRPEALNESQKQKVVRLVFKWRGKSKVTVAFCKKRLSFLRKVGNTTVENALHEAGLKYLTRRMKSWVPKESKEESIKYCEWVLGRQQ
eukprot:1227904-Karenia_brevis.AAC.1